MGSIEHLGPARTRLATPPVMFFNRGVRCRCVAPRGAPRRAWEGFTPVEMRAMLYGLRALT